MIYRKAGRVTWYSGRIEVVLEPYRFNAVNARWRDGRLIRISVALPG